MSKPGKNGFFNFFHNKVGENMDNRRAHLTFKILFVVEVIVFEIIWIGNKSNNFIMLLTHRFVCSQLLILVLLESLSSVVRARFAGMEVDKDLTS